MKIYDLEVEKLYVIENEEDECCEIIERDGVEPGEDALVAKFYCSYQLASILVVFLQSMSAEYRNTGQAHWSTS